VAVYVPQFYCAAKSGLSAIGIVRLNFSTHGGATRVLFFCPSFVSRELHAEIIAALQPLRG